MQDLVAIYFGFCIASTYFGSALVYGQGSNIYDVIKFGAIGTGQADESKAFLTAWERVCEDTGEQGIPTLSIPEGSFLVLPISFQGPCKAPSINVEVIGNIVAPDTIAAWSGSDKFWLKFSDIDGLIMYGKGLFNGQGSIWWNKSGGQRHCSRPTSVDFHKCNNLQVYHVSFQDSPKNHISISCCNGVTISNIHINAPQDSPNTDGIDISNSSYVNIHDSTIQTGDDCIAINSGSSNINITNIACGPGHGISVGSLGESGAYQTVEEVQVRGCTFTGTQNGARIKTWAGGAGYARKISFEQITLVEAKNPIIIDQYYNAIDKTCSRPPPPKKLQQSAVQISDVTFSGFQGTSASKQAITLTCSDVTDCTGILMDHVNLTSSEPGVQLFSHCSNVHGKSTITVPPVPCLSG